MILLAMMAETAIYNPRLIGVGEPLNAEKFANDARVCGYSVTVRPWKDGDIVPKPAGVKVGSRVVVADQPIDPNDPRLPCLLKTEENLIVSMRR